MTTLAAPGAGMRDRVVRAGFWSVLLQATGRLFGLARSVIVARVLAPDDIGLFAVASVTLLAVDTLSKTGFQSALVHRAGNIDHDLNVAWSFHLVRGFLRAGALFILAPFVARFFDTPAAELLIQLVAVAMIVEGFTNSGVIYFTKELALRKQFQLDVSRLLTDLCVSVAAALLLKSAIALTYGLVAGYVVQVIVSYRIHPFRPRVTFDRPTLKRLMSYGVWMNLHGIMLFVGTHGASIVIGKVIDVRALGLYQMAHWITQSALIDLAGAVNVVAFSAFSQMQDDAPRLRAAFLKMAGFAVGAALPAAIGIILLGDLFVNVALGAKWAGMGPALRLLAVAGCLHAIALSGRPVFLGLGQPRSLFLMQGLGAAVLLSCVYPLARTHGVTGAAAAMIAGSFAMTVYWYPHVRRLLDLSLGDFRQIFGPAVVGTLAMSVVAGVGAGFAKNGEGVTGAAWLVGLTAASAAVYLVTLRAVEPLFPGNQPLGALRAFFGRPSISKPVAGASGN